MTLASFLRSHQALVHIRLTRVRGSSPRDAGAEMFVALDATHGTIGGGQLEYMATDKARAMLRSNTDAAHMDVPLGPEIGQCCGGRVDLQLSMMTATDRATVLAAAAAREAANPHVYILGSGHIGQALARFFQFLPVHCVLIDSRPEALALAQAEVEKRLSVMAEADIRRAPAGSAFIVLTHDHALDFLLASEALARGDASYVGLIGSATKRVRFERFHNAQAPDASARDLVCPIGATGSTDKRPEVIASFVVAEVMARLTTVTARQRIGIN